MKKINQSGILLKYCPCLVALALVCPGLSVVAMNGLDEPQEGEVNERIELDKSSINNKTINLQLEKSQTDKNLGDYENSFMEYDKKNDELKGEIENNMGEEEKVTTILKEDTGSDEKKYEKDNDESEKNNDRDENDNVENPKEEMDSNKVVELREQRKRQDKEAGDSDSENELNIKESMRINDKYEDDILNDKVDLDEDEFYGEDAEKIIKENITAVCGGLDYCAKLKDVPYSGTKTASDMENDPLFRWIARMIDENRMQNINNPDDKIRDTAYGSNPRFYDFGKSGVGLYWDFVGEKYKPQPGRRCYVNDYRAIAGMVTDAINLYYFICRKWGYDAVKNAFTNEITVETTDCTLEKALAGSIRKDIHRYFRTYLDQESNDSHILGLYCFYSIVQDVFGTERKIDWADDDERNEWDEVNDKISDEEDDIDGGAIRKSQADNYIKFLKKNCNLQKVIKYGTSMVDNILKARHDPERRGEWGSTINTSGEIWYPFESIDKSIAEKQASVKEYITKTDGWCDDIRGSVNRYWRSIFNEIRRKFRKGDGLSYEYSQGERLYDLMRKKRCYLPLLGIFFVEDAVYGDNCVYTWLDVAWRAKHWNERLAVRKRLQCEYFPEYKDCEELAEGKFEIYSDDEDEVIKTKRAWIKDVDEQVDKKVGSINKIEEMIFNGNESESLCDILNEIMDSILGGVPLRCLYRAMGTDDKGNTVVNCSNPYGSTDLKNGESLLCVEFCQSYDDKKYPLRFRNGNGSMKNMVGLHGETLLSSEEMLSINEGERILAACVPVDLADGVFGGKTEEDGLSVAESVAEKVSGTVRLLTAVGDHLKCEDVVANKGANVWFAKSYDLMREDYCGEDDFVRAVRDMLVSYYETVLYNREVELYNQSVELRGGNKDSKRKVVGRVFDRNKFVGSWVDKVFEHICKENRSKGFDIFDARRGDEVRELAEKMRDCEYVKEIMGKIADENGKLLRKVNELRSDKYEQQEELEKRKIEISNLQKKLSEKNKLIEQNKRKVNKYKLNRIDEMDDDEVDSSDMLNMTMTAGTYQNGETSISKKMAARSKFKEGQKEYSKIKDLEGRLKETEKQLETLQTNSLSYDSVYSPLDENEHFATLTFSKIESGAFKSCIKGLGEKIKKTSRGRITNHEDYLYYGNVNRQPEKEEQKWYTILCTEIFEKAKDVCKDKSAKDACDMMGLEVGYVDVKLIKGRRTYEIEIRKASSEETFSEFLEGWENNNKVSNDYVKCFRIK